MRRTPVRYALWSLLVLAPTMIILPALISTHADFTSLGADTGPMTAVIAIFALMIAAFVSPAIVLPEGREFPAWSWVAILVGLLQLFAILFGYGSVPPGAYATAVYIPAAIVCLNLTALIILHAWVASEGMGFSPAVGLATGLAYSLWVVGAGTSQKFDAFLGISTVLLILALVTAFVAAFVRSAYEQTAAVKDTSGRA